MLIVTISRTSRHFSLVDARSRSQLHVAGALITYSDSLIFFYFKYGFILKKFINSSPPPPPRFGFFVKKITYSSPFPPPPHPLLQKKKNKFGSISIVKKFTNSSPPPTPLLTKKKRKKEKIFRFGFLVKKTKTLSLASNLPPPPPPHFFFFRI